MNLSNFEWFISIKVLCNSLYVSHTVSLSCSLGKLHDSNLSRRKENLVTFNIRLIVPKSENTLNRLYLDFDPISTELKPLLEIF